MNKAVKTLFILATLRHPGLPLAPPGDRGTSHALDRNRPLQAIRAEASRALTRATPAAVHTAEPRGVGKPSAVRRRASSLCDSGPSVSRRLMIGAKSAARAFALATLARLAAAVDGKAAQR
jgi:hypothetical protein